MKLTVDLSYAQTDAILKDSLIEDANTLWENHSEESLKWLEGLKVYMEYCGVEWVPPSGDDGMEIY